MPTWKLEAGLWLYDLLALFRNVRLHRMLSKRSMLQAEPGLRPQGLKGGAFIFLAAHQANWEISAKAARMWNRVASCSDWAK